MRIYGIYNIKEKEQCMRVGTLEEISMKYIIYIMSRRYL